MKELVYCNRSHTIWENYLVVFVSLGFCPRIYFGISLEICHVEKNKNKNNGISKFALGSLCGGRPNVNFGRPWNLIHSPSFRTPCRLFIHEVFGSLGLHLRVRSELGQSPPFRPMRALRLQWSWAFSLVCEVALRTHSLSRPFGDQV